MLPTVDAPVKNLAAFIHLQYVKKRFITMTQKQREEKRKRGGYCRIWPMHILHNQRFCLER